MCWLIEKPNFKTSLFHLHPSKSRWKLFGYKDGHQRHSFECIFELCWCLSIAEIFPFGSTLLQRDDWILFLSCRRVESFIEHQDLCNMGRLRSETQALLPACLSRTASSLSHSGETNFTTVPWLPRPPACNSNMFPKPRESMFLLSPKAVYSSSKNNICNNNNNSGRQYQNLELQLSTASNPIDVSVSIERDDNHSTQLQLSIGSSDIGTCNWIWCLKYDSLFLEFVSVCY